MTVIINDFEIDLVSNNEETDTESPSESAQIPNPITPLDLKDIRQWDSQRRNRLRAH